MMRWIGMVLGLLGTLSGGVRALPITDQELVGLDWHYTQDPGNDAASSNGNSFFTYGMGHAISGGYLYVVVQTNFPEMGALGGDSYTYNTHFSPGDLYINVGGTFQNGGGSIYGIATTSHANVVQQAYSGQVWQSMIAGRLYSDPTFATGTYEQYQHTHPSFAPDDGDGNNRINSYPTLMMGGTLVDGDVSGVRYRANTTDPWAYDIYYKVSLASLGINMVVPETALQLFWVMECGNDGVQNITEPVGRAIPEPGTVALLLAGVTALAAERRRRHA